MSAPQSRETFPGSGVWTFEPPWEDEGYPRTITEAFYVADTFQEHPWTADQFERAYKLRHPPIVDKVEHPMVVAMRALIAACEECIRAIEHFGVEWRAGEDAVIAEMEERS